MSQIEEILAALPIDQIAARVGATPEETRQAAAAAVPALVGGLEANAQDPAGAASIAAALGDHDASVFEQADLSAVDPADGARIAGHIFGDQQAQVAQQLGGLGGGNALVQKIIPIIAPIVMAWLVKQVTAKAGGALPGGLGSSPAVQDALTQVLSGALGGGQSTPAPQPGGLNAGSIVTDVLGGLLGGGRR